MQSKYREELQFLGAFAKLRNATISFAISVHPPAWNSASAGLFAKSFILGPFTAVCRENSNLVEVGQQHKALYMTTKHIYNVNRRIFAGMRKKF